MLLYHVRLNQIDFLFVCFVLLAQLLLLGGKSKCLFHLTVPISLEVLRPKGAELLHLRLFFLAGRGLGDPTSPEPNCFHSKPDVSSPPLSLPHQTLLIDSVSRHSLTAAVKMTPKLCSNATGSKCLSSFLSVFLSAVKCKTSHHFLPSFALRVAKRQQKKKIFPELMSSCFTGIIRSCSPQFA